MLPNRIDGKAISEEVKREVAVSVAALKKQGIETGLAVIIVGNNSASRVYVNNKKKACEAVGIQSFEFALPAETTQSELLALIDRLNQDKSCNGILVQLPLPEHIAEDKVIEAISIEKDVDAFHPYNVGRMMIGDYTFLPCTPAGVIRLIESTGAQISGKHCVIVGRSNIVGKPMAMLLLHRNATVTICHSKTVDLTNICRQADILISAVGIAHFIKPNMVREGAMVIDVGINRDQNGKLCGDVDTEAVAAISGYITPVPGGVGPMTIAMLLKNTVAAAKIQHGLIE